MAEHLDSRNIDPQLKRAREEVTQVLQRYDIAGAVILSSKTHSEFWQTLPTWAGASFDDDGKLTVHLRSADQERTHHAVSLAFTQRDIFALWSMGMIELCGEIEKRLQVAHVAFGQHGVTKDVG